MASEGRPRKVAGIMFGFSNLNVDPEQEAWQAVDFGPGFDEVFAAGVSAARELKEHIVVNGPEDVPVLATAVMPQGAFQLPVYEMCERMNTRPPQALAMALEAVTGALGRPIAVVLLLETLFRKIEHEEDHVPLRPGEMSERWDAGDREGLLEALVVTFATATQYRSEFMPYHYGDGSVVWDEGSTTDTPEGWPDGELTGNVEEAIAVAFRQQGEPDGTG